MTGPTSECYKSDPNGDPKHIPTEESGRLSACWLWPCQSCRWRSGTNVRTLARDGTNKIYCKAERKHSCIVMALYETHKNNMYILIIQTDCSTHLHLLNFFAVAHAPKLESCFAFTWLAQDMLIQTYLQIFAFVRFSILMQSRGPRTRQMIFGN